MTDRLVEPTACIIKFIRRFFPNISKYYAKNGIVTLLSQNAPRLAAGMNGEETLRSLGEGGWMAMESFAIIIEDPSWLSMGRLQFFIRWDQ
ncbi:MAG: hypothetical protein AB1502_02505 [Thermodesulfobacteriota bacterium]